MEDSEQVFQWDCRRIEKAKSGETIRSYEGKYQDSSRKKVDETVSRIYSAPYKFAASLGIKIKMKTKSGGWTDSGNVKFSMPYKPIEKTINP